MAVASHAGQDIESWENWRLNWPSAHAVQDESWIDNTWDCAFALPVGPCPSECEFLGNSNQAPHRVLLPMDCHNSLWA
jgi:hypothetical protein